MGKGNDNDRYVVKRSDGWAVVKEDHERASAVTPRNAKRSTERRRSLTTWVVARFEFKTAMASFEKVIESGSPFPIRSTLS
jgi:hypothetical protein